MNRAVRWIVLGFVFATALFAEAYAAERRVALVIGNAAYRSVPALQNSRTDADDISEQLSRLGFAVIDGRDLDRSAMQAALTRFAQRLRGADAGLFYYSGHGLQVNGQNFLVPVDLKLEDGEFTPFELVKLDDVIEALSYTDGARLLVLDACRYNPFADNVARYKGNRSVGMTRGLARIERSQGMLIAYATQPNAIASDGSGRNSPFTAALVREMQVPGLEIGTLFRRVAINVYHETGGAQTPELSVSLLRDFYLNQQESDITAWQKLGPSASVADLNTFISRFPNSAMVNAARAWLEAIENAHEGERLLREYSEKERRLREELQAAEASYRKAASELAERRERDERERLINAKTEEASVTAATSLEPVAGAKDGVPDITARTPEGGAGEQRIQEPASEERERLASHVAALDADRARIADERKALERALTESLARSQSERERAEQRLAAETARLPASALDQMRTTPPATPQRPALTCREINERIQLGDVTQADRDTLIRGCR